MFKTETKQFRCQSCNQPTRHERTVRYPNHILHLILSLITLGVWIPVWLFLTLTPDKDHWHCSTCGGRPAGESTAFLRKVGLSLVIGIPAVMILAYLATR